MVHRRICALLLGMLCMSLACAAPDAAPRYELSIRAGLSLDEALQELARQSGVQLLFISNIAAGHSAPELSGEYTLDAAMKRLLEGSDLTFRQVNEHTVEVRRAPARTARPPPATPTANEPMEEVLVVGKVEQLVATRIPTPVWEIPQSISVISPEQIRQQNSFELGDVLLNAPGIAVRRTSSMSDTAYSRAFPVTSYHVDGGGALTDTIYDSPLREGDPDLSEYDRVEVLRGSDALFSGNSDPGGTVSLVRKRPLATPSFEMSTTLGSWNNYRIELDTTGPLTDDGALRGRADVVYANRDYFFDRAHLERKKAFGVVEYDFSPTATLTAGGSYQSDDALPLNSPATQNSNFSDAHLPRSTGLTFDWAFYNTRIGEAYVQYRQQFAADWILKLNALAGRTIADYAYAKFRGQLNSFQSLGFPIAFFSTRPDHIDLDAMDATLTGKFDWFGRRALVAIGGDFTRLRGRRSGGSYFGFGPPLMNIRTFDPKMYPDPRDTRAPDLAGDVRTVLEQYGGFVWLQVDLTDALSLTGGARLASDTYRTDADLWSGGVYLLSFSREASNSHVLQPYGALMYRINDHLSWYASYADIYRTPYPVRVDSGGRLIGPKHGITFESGIKGVWRDGAVNGSLALYRLEERRVPVQIAQVTDPYRSGTGRSQGVELQVDGELAPGWLIGSGYTYNQFEQPNSEIPITSTPRHDLKIWTSAQLPGVLSRWTVGGSLRAQAKWRGSATLFCDAQVRNCKPGETKIMRSYAVFDLRAGFELDGNWQAALSVNNVLDKRYYVSQTTPGMEVWFGEPRSFMLRIDAKF